MISFSDSVGLHTTDLVYKLSMGLSTLTSYEIIEVNILSLEEYLNKDQQVQCSSYNAST